MQISQTELLQMKDAFDAIADAARLQSKLVTALIKRERARVTSSLTKDK